MYKLIRLPAAVCSLKPRVSVQGVKLLGGHFVCLCRGFNFHEVKKINKKILFQKENGNTITLEKSSKRANSTNYQNDP